MTGIDLVCQPYLQGPQLKHNVLFNGPEPSMQIAHQIFGSTFTQMCSKRKFCETLSTENDANSVNLVVQ